jgi:murein DD-endopeptidase MepM/ murein hydrolase activator NlpD
MPLLNRSLAAVVLLALAPGCVPRAEPPVIHWRPDPPRQGSLLVLLVQPHGADSSAAVAGALAGESLHFEPDGRGAFIALGAVPLGAGDTLLLDVTVNGTTYPTSLPVARRTASREELRTASRFTRPPDSALAARIERERGMMAAVAARAHATPRLWSEPFARPRRAPIRSGFGLEREFNDVVESRHLGVDFAGRRGAPVYAANRGVVVLVESLFYAGRTVYLDHGAGLLTAYMHLDRALVAPGDTVRRGQLIGRVGATGRVTGPHLHWVARYGAILVDPLDLVTLDLTPLAGGRAKLEGDRDPQAR